MGETRLVTVQTRQTQSRHSVSYRKDQTPAEQKPKQPLSTKAHHLTIMSGFAYLTQMRLLITVAMMPNSLCTIV